MPLKIISGGQCGADIAGVAAAKFCGLPTGGCMPKGFLTLEGPKPEYAELYGMVEHVSDKYPPRTYDNVKNSEATIQFAFDFWSPGERCTEKAIKQYSRESLKVDLNEPIVCSDIVSFIISNNVRVLNIAGNTQRTDSRTYQLTYDCLVTVFKMMRGIKNGI